MTVYVDDMRLKATVGSLTARWSHLIAGPGGDLAELHAFARSIGLRRSWFQGPPEHRHPHYDVTDTKRREAIKAGAVAITWREAGLMLAAHRKAPALAPPPPAAPDRPEAGHSCYCGETAGTHLFACGYRCPKHTPAAEAGLPEPGADRYCAPFRCYCDTPVCTSIVRPPEPVRDTITDLRHKASGKRRSSPAAYRDARDAIHGRPA